MKKKREPSRVDQLMAIQIHEIRGDWDEEFKFCEDRKWRFDFVITGAKIAIEIEGGAFTQGRHTRGVGFINDMEKYNHATLLGWRVLRFTPSQVLDGSAIKFILKVLLFSNWI